MFGYIGWSESADQMELIRKRQDKLAGLSKRVNQAAELQDIVNTVAIWQRNDITWLDELKDLSDRFPERNESLVRKMTMSGADNGAGVVDLSVQVNSPEVITELESAIRDDRHSVSSKRVTEISDAEELTWSFETRIVFRPLPRPKKTLPEPIEEVTVDGLALDDSAVSDDASSKVNDSQDQTGAADQPTDDLDRKTTTESETSSGDGEQQSGSGGDDPSDRDKTSGQRDRESAS